MISRNAQTIIIWVEKSAQKENLKEIKYQKTIELWDRGIFEVVKLWVKSQSKQLFYMPLVTNF